MFSLLGLTALSDDPENRLFELNVFVGSAIIFMTLGGFLVVEAASSLGGVTSAAFRPRIPWLLLPLFPLALVAGQLQANEPAQLPWLFPIINIVVVAVPSVLVAGVVLRRYQGANPFAWPWSRREVTSAFTWGAIGATTIAGVINTVYLWVGGAWFIERWGRGDAWNVGSNIDTLEDGIGVFFDLSVLSIVAPLNEEFLKGSLVALFFFRKGGAARCFAWGVLAGAGFNLLETFLNSLAAANPEALAEQTIGNQWWLFGAARAGTAVLHGFAAGLAALGFYGVLRREWHLAPLYLAGVSLHGMWNGLAYLVGGDVFLSEEGPDAAWLDVAGIAGMAVLAVGCAVGAWLVSGRLQDARPAPVYSMLGMRPRTLMEEPEPAPFLLQELAGR